VAKSHKPGTRAPSSAQYKPARGGAEITVPKGHRLPPGPRKGTTWVIADRTKNKSGRA
jgi:hypothetical protein